MSEKAERRQKPQQSAPRSSHDHHQPDTATPDGGWQGAEQESYINEHPDQIMRLQSTVGNQAARRLLRRSMPTPAIISRYSRAPRHTIQRGEAGVHQGIEMDAWNTEAPELGAGGPASSDQQGAMEVYVGNWMRDFSQVFVPTVMENVSQIPQRPGDPDSAVIGAEGGEALVTGLLRALASLEFGQGITDALVTGGPAGNIGVYRPEEHMDNPAGMSYEGDSLVRDADDNLATGDQAFSDQLEGSAGLGPQMENTALYGVSAEGLDNHIYNTIEAVKGNFISAYDIGATPQGRMMFGTGLHGVEDYFAHSNFIEVGLNVLLESNPDLIPYNFGTNTQHGGHQVDTMYDATVQTPIGGERQAITTGTFGPKDTQISIAHAIMPKLPILFTSVDGAIDRALLALEQEGSTWDDIQATLKGDPAGLAFTYILDGLEEASMQFPVGVLQTYTIPDLPGILPDAIEDNLEGKIIPIGFEDQYMTPKQAMPAYKRLYDQAKDIWEYRTLLKTILQQLLRLDFLLDNTLVQQIRKAISLLNQTLSDLMKQFRQQLKQKVREKMFEMIETLTGVDVPAEKRAHLEEWLHAVHEGVEEMGHSTSLESRMQSGGDLANLSKEERAARIPKGPLPPSHSEISKDHPDHPHEEEHSVHGPTAGSPFYELHRRLAVSAVEHLGMLMESAWQSDDPTAQLIPGSDREFDGLAERNAEASRASQRAEALANEENRAYAQRDGHPPELESVLDAVDLYISHPEDSNWWRSIMEAYISEEPLQVMGDIERRNAARPNRE